MSLPGVMVIYHANCRDGFGAAYAAWRKFGAGERDWPAEYIPMDYGKPIPWNAAGKLLYVLDFSFPRKEIEVAYHNCANVTIIDHHKTAEAQLAGLPGVTFDMAHSGAYLAWKHFFPMDEVPMLIQYIEDRDLWKWELPDSKAIAAWLDSWPFDFHIWKSLFDVKLADAAAEGYAILRYQKEQVERMCVRVVKMKLRGFDGNNEAQDWWVPAVNATSLFSEVANRLCEVHSKFPFAVAWFRRGDGKYQYSLRSIGDFDVSAIAQYYGGGGHVHAAGFETEELLPMETMR